MRHFRALIGLEALALSPAPGKANLISMDFAGGVPSAVVLHQR